MSITGLTKSRTERMHRVLSGYIERKDMPGLVALVSQYDDVPVLIARVLGQSLGGFLRKRIFDPLGMRDTALHLPSETNLESIVLEEFDQFAVEAPHKADAKGVYRLIGVGRSEVLRLHGHGCAGLFGPLDGGIAIGGAEGVVHKDPLGQHLCAARKDLQIVSVARVQQADPAILLALRPAILAPAIDSAEAQPVAIERQRRVVIERPEGQMVKSASADGRVVAVVRHSSFSLVNYLIRCAPCDAVVA